MFVYESQPSSPRRVAGLLPPPDSKTDVDNPMQQKEPQKDMGNQEEESTPFSIRTEESRKVLNAIEGLCGPLSERQSSENVGTSKSCQLL